MKQLQSPYWSPPTTDDLITKNDSMVWFDHSITNCWTYQIINSFLDTENGIRPVNLKLIFFKPWSSGGDNSANTSIPTEHKARDTSIKWQRTLKNFRYDMASSVWVKIRISLTNRICLSQKSLTAFNVPKPWPMARVNQSCELWFSLINNFERAESISSIWDQIFTLVTLEVPE